MTRHASVLNRIGQIFDAILLNGADHLARRELNGIAGAGKAGAHIKEGIAQKRASQKKYSQPVRVGFLPPGIPGILGSRGVWELLSLRSSGHLRINLRFQMPRYGRLR